MQLKLSTRSIEPNETVHVYGNDKEGWEVILKREGSGNGHLLFPHMFTRKIYSLEECLDFIQRTMDAGRTGWGFNCSCCGHTSDTNIREVA